MTKFEFRLERVRDYRQLEEDWSRATYLEARAARVAHEAKIAGLLQIRVGVLTQSISGLDAHRTLESYLIHSDDEERLENAALNVLQDEEAAALTQWQIKKQDVQVLDRLREQALEEWTHEESRLEQAALDEWSVTRRAA